MRGKHIPMTTARMRSAASVQSSSWLLLLISALRGDMRAQPGNTEANITRARTVAVVRAALRARGMAVPKHKEQQHVQA